MQVAKAQAMEKIESDRQVQTMIPVKNPTYTTINKVIPSETLE
jgi:hypothetical protein